MAVGKRRDDWQRTALLACLIHNDPEGRRPRRPITAFSPFTWGKPEKPPVQISDPRLINDLIGGTLETVK